MKKIVIIYGLMASLFIVGISAILLWSGHESGSEWLGYLIMIIGFSFTFIAIKNYRDKNLGGLISFTQALQVGILVTLIACFFYVITWEIYYQTGGQDFIQVYQDSYVESLKAKGTSKTEIDAAILELQDFAIQYENLLFRIFITLIEILPVGLIVSIISSLFLKNKKSKTI